MVVLLLIVSMVVGFGLSMLVGFWLSFGLARCLTGSRSDADEYWRRYQRLQLDRRWLLEVIGRLEKRLGQADPLLDLDLVHGLMFSEETLAAFKNSGRRQAAYQRMGREWPPVKEEEGVIGGGVVVLDFENCGPRATGDVAANCQGRCVINRSVVSEDETVCFSHCGEE